MKQIHILLVEDNEGDIFLTTEALEDSKIINRVTIIKNGEKAIDFFRDLVDFKELPDLILLDVNLPKKNGHQVLHYLKNNELYKHIPVIMLTTSSTEKDIVAAYKNHVNCYITKPIEAIEFLNAITKIEDFWINIVSIPTK